MLSRIEVLKHEIKKTFYTIFVCDTQSCLLKFIIEQLE